MTDPGWVPESRPVPEALTDTYAPPPFNGVPAGRDWVSLEEKLDADGWALLMRFGAIGDPNGNAGTAT
jgi:hypothetical protein